MDQVICVNGEAGCSACGACLAVCPKQAISMRENQYGFLYPCIDQNLCVGCGKCIQICKSCAEILGASPLSAYAAAGKNADLISHSASGGIFASIAQIVLKNGGKVAGAIMNLGGEKVEVLHILSDTIQDLQRMQGSKYVQSDAWKCYKEIIEALQKGETVLFSGTPCQVAAVKNITGDPENLLTMDVVCHGVPSSAMLQGYLEILKKRFFGNIEDLLFRDKTTNKPFCACIGTKQGKFKHKYYLRSSYISYYKYFLESTIYRDNCYNCPYACGKRVSDLTIGDYWGIEQIHKKEIYSDKFKDHKHWSCLLVNTEKGLQLLNQCCNCLDLIPSQVTWIAKGNQQLNMPSKKPAERETILGLYVDGGYAAIERMFIRKSGGKLRYYMRAYKDMCKNHINRKSN